MAFKWGISVFKSSAHPGEIINKIEDYYLNALLKLEASYVALEEVCSYDLLFYFILTGGTEESAFEVVNRRIKAGLTSPVFLIAHPGHNSLPASLELLAKLQQDGIPGKILYLSDPEDLLGINGIKIAKENTSVFYKLNQSRMGLIGTPSNWLVASSPDPGVVKSSWGIHIHEFTMAEMYALIESKKNMNQNKELSDSFVNIAQSCNLPQNVELEKAISLYLALKELTKRNKLDAITIRCFDVLQDLETTGCFALSQLNDSGIIAGCEGDIVSAVGMLWVYYLTGKIPWMANPAQIKLSENTLWLAHCTVPRTLVGKYQVTTHFESQMGVAIQGHFEPGPVTLLRIGGKKLDKIWITDAEIRNSGISPSLCRTQIEVHLEDTSVSDLLNQPLGNHLVVVPGTRKNRMIQWLKLFKPHVEIRPESHD